MNEDPIRRLLQQADREAGHVPAAGGNLASDARRALRRRHIVRASTAAALLVISGVLAAGWWLRGERRSPEPPAVVRHETPSPPAETSPRDARDLALLKERIALQQQWIDYLALAEEERRARATLAQLGVPPDPHEQVRAEVDRAAQTLVRYGYRLEKGLNRPQEAMETYRRVEQLFPETSWAEVARERIRVLSES